MADNELDEVRIFPIGEPVPEGRVLFEGSTAAARDFLRQLSAAERAEVAVWTPGHIFTTAGFEAEAPGHEHDPG